MVAVRYMEASPTPQLAFVAMIEILNPVQVVQIPRGGCMLAVDFKCIQRFMASRVAGRFESGQRAILKLAQKRAGIIDPDRFYSSCQVVLAFLDEGLGHGRDGGDRAIQP